MEKKNAQLFTIEQHMVQIKNRLSKVKNDEFKYTFIHSTPKKMLDICILWNPMAHIWAINI